MPRKQVNSSSSGAKPATTKPASATATDGKPAPDLDALRAQARARAQLRPMSQTPVNYKLYLIFLIVPIVSMLWSAEAPKRPFSLLTAPRIGAKAVTDDSKPSLIDPRILVLTAHPDDEILFAPTILELLSDEKKNSTMLWSLCLSTGDFGGGPELSEKRKAEWNKSWASFGLEEDKRSILDIPKLKDNPELAWDPSAIADQVAPFVLKHEIDTILTFDQDGVTGHPQHGSLSAGVVHMLSSPLFTKKLKKGAIMPRLFVLKTYQPGSHLSFFSPIVEHLSLGGSALMSDFRGYGAPPPDPNSPALKERYVKSPPTIFITNMKRYYKMWLAALEHKTQQSAKAFVLLAVGKTAWVNEWNAVDIS